jgi:cyclophilin family peptidyl-prolyl cis-trans isomerase
MSGRRHLGLAALASAAIVASFAAAPASAQTTLRFTTSVGAFDMELNPTNDSNLQPLVDNIVAYVGLGRYHYTAINRAAKQQDGSDFVLQMGSFLGFPPTTNNWLGLLQEVNGLNPVVTDADGDGQVDFDAISNTRGTVSLALSGQPNSGSSSFFVNLGDNSFLDSQGFVPFARVNDLSTIDRIMELEQIDLTGDPSNLTFSNVPLQENGRLVILKSVHVLQAAPSFSFTGPIAAALAQEEENADAAAAAALMESAAAAVMAAEDVSAEHMSFDLGEPAIVPASAPAFAQVPEPAAGALATIMAIMLAAKRRRRS